MNAPLCSLYSLPLILQLETQDHAALGAVAAAAPVVAGAGTGPFVAALAPFPPRRSRIVVAHLPTRPLLADLSKISGGWRWSVLRRYLPIGCPWKGQHQGQEHSPPSTHNCERDLAQIFDPHVEAGLEERMQIGRPLGGLPGTVKAHMVLEGCNKIKKGGHGCDAREGKRQ